MKWREPLKDYFTFTVKEQKGIWMLSVLILVLITARMAISRQGAGPTVDYSSFEENVRILESLAEDTIRRDTTPVVSKPVQYSAGTTDRHSVTGSHVSEARWKEHSKRTVELNTADSTDLVMLNGIGPVLSTRILKYRELLGGFYDVDQLEEVFGMDTLILKTLKPFLAADASQVRGLDLNNATFRELLHHPYLEYEDVKKMINFRDRSGGFRSADELFGIDGLDTNLVRRILPYIRIAEEGR